jgi:hypothetical protein
LDGFLAFLLHLIRNLEGGIVNVVLTRGNCDDREGAMLLMQTLNGGVSLADLGYRGEDFLIPIYACGWLDTTRLRLVWSFNFNLKLPFLTSTPCFCDAESGGECVCAWLADAIAKKIANTKKNLTKLFRDIKILLPAAMIRQRLNVLVVG